MQHPIKKQINNSINHNQELIVKYSQSKVAQLFQTIKNTDFLNNSFTVSNSNQLAMTDVIQVQKSNNENYKSKLQFIGCFNNLIYNQVCDQMSGIFNKSFSKQLSKRPKSLNQISKIVLKIIKDLQISTCSQITNEFINRMNAPQYRNCGKLKISGKKNYQRRINSSINIMIGAGVIKKVKNIITFY